MYLIHPLNSENEIEKLLYDFKILFAYHSGKIENSQIEYHDTRDIFEKGEVTSFSGSIRTIMEISNQKTCYEFLKKKIVEKEPITIDFIKRVHYLLTKGTYDDKRYNVLHERAGQFKKHEFVVGIHEVGSQPEDVEEELTQLLDEINDEGIEDYFTAGAYFHAQFENIHPFADGNGRVGRSLLNYYYMIHNIAPVIVKNETKKLYYEALEAYDVKEDLEPLRLFLLYSQEQTWQKHLDLVIDQEDCEKVGKEL